MFRSDKNRTGIRLAVGLAAMLATTAQASDCQSLLRDRASLTLALDDIRDEYPKLTQALDYCERCNCCFRNGVASSTAQSC